MRQPNAMEADLLQDLVQYKKHKDKGVVMAARSLLALFRDVDSAMLVKRDRGKVRDQHKKSAFGAQSVARGVQGLELLGEKTDSDDSDNDSDASGSPRIRSEDGEDESDEQGGSEIDSADEEGGNDGEEESEQEDTRGEGVDEDKEDEDEDEEEEEEEEVPHPNGEEEAFGEDTRVAARFKGSKQLYAGTVHRRNKDGTYWVIFDDEDADRRVKGVNVGLYRPEDFEDDADEGAEKEDELERLDATRPLTAEEFEKIRKLRAKRELEASLGKRGPDSESLTVQGRLSSDDMLGQHKKRRMDKAGRLASVLAGREGREDGWKDRWEKKKQAGGLRNDQAKKNKPYLMVKQSFKVRSKMKEGVGDKNTQAWLRKKQQRGSGGGKHAAK